MAMTQAQLDALLQQMAAGTATPAQTQQASTTLDNLVNYDEYGAGNTSGWVSKSMATPQDLFGADYQQGDRENPAYLDAQMSGKSTAGIQQWLTPQQIASGTSYLLPNSSANSIPGQGLASLQQLSSYTSGLPSAAQASTPRRSQKGTSDSMTAAPYDPLVTTGKAPAPTASPTTTAQSPAGGGLTWAEIQNAWQAAGDPYSGQFNVPGLGMVSPTVIAGQNGPNWHTTGIEQGDQLLSANEDGYSGPVDLWGVTPNGRDVYRTTFTNQNGQFAPTGSLSEYTEKGLTPFDYGVMAFLAAATAGIGGAAIAGAGAAGAAGGVGSTVGEVGSTGVGATGTGAVGATGTGVTDLGGGFMGSTGLGATGTGGVGSVGSVAGSLGSTAYGDLGYTGVGALGSVGGAGLGAVNGGTVTGTPVEGSTVGSSVGTSVTPPGGPTDLGGGFMGSTGVGATGPGGVGSVSSTAEGLGPSAYTNLGYTGSTGLGLPNLSPSQLSNLGKLLGGSTTSGTSSGVGSAGGGLNLGSVLGLLGQLGTSSYVQNLISSASQTSQNYTNQYNTEIGQLNQMLNPFAQYRNQYAQQLNALEANPSSVTKLPGYQFGIDQGEQALQRASAAQGNFQSGQTGLAIDQYAQQYAGQYLQQQEQNLAQLSGANFSPTAINPATAGNPGAMMLEAAGSTSNNLNNLLAGLGSSATTQGGAVNGLLGGLGSILGIGNKGTTGSTGTGSTYQQQHTGGYTYNYQTHSYQPNGSIGSIGSVPDPTPPITSPGPYSYWGEGTTFGGKRPGTSNIAGRS